MASYFLQPRWIPWHVLCAVIAVAFVRLGFWQWSVAHRQTPTDWQNSGYALQWIAFAGFVAWFWYKFIRDSYVLETAEAEELAAEQEIS